MSDYPWDPEAQARMAAAGEEVPPPPPPPTPAPPGPGGGFQAARLGDQTAHFSTIGPYVTGLSARVTIAGQPAACQTDPHLCPMFDGPKPHVGGIIAMGSPTVLIGGLPAARVTDPIQCMGPPGVIAFGAPTVFIGNAGMGSGPGSPGPPASAFKNAAKSGAALVCKGPCEACGHV